MRGGLSRDPPGPGGPRRSCGRWWFVSSTTGRRTSDVGRQSRQKRLDELAVLVVVEVLLDDLAGARDREVDGFAPQLGDRLVALDPDVAAGALEEVRLLAARLFEEVGPHLLRDGTPVSDELLGFVAGAVDGRLVLGQQLGG